MNEIKIKPEHIKQKQTQWSEQNSKWYGSHQRGKFRLALMFYSPEGNEVSMPLASISAFLKSQLDNIEVKLFTVFSEQGEEYNAENFIAGLKDWQPDLIAISIMSPHWFPLQDYLSLISSTISNTPVLVGGYQAIMSPEQTIANEAVHFICVGDGEYGSYDLIRYLKGEHKGPVEGFWEKLADGSILKTDPTQIDDIAALPFPDYEIFTKNGQLTHLDTSLIGGQKRLVLPAMTGRGCPYKCTYCCNTPLLENWHSKKTFIRKYEVNSLVDELVRLKEQYGVEYFEFWDELFMSNLKFCKAFFKLYKEKVGLPFAMNSRVEVMSEKFCKMAADAGCHTIWFGIESGDDYYRTEVLGRKMSNDKIIAAADNCKHSGIQRLTFNIVGMPFENKQQMLQTLELNKRIAPEFFYFFTYIPLRGTPLYNRAKESDLLITSDDKLKVTQYLGKSDGKYRMNIKNNTLGMPNEDEFNEVCELMASFQASNNRLDYRKTSEDYILEDKALKENVTSEPELEEIQVPEKENLLRKFYNFIFH